MYQLALLDVADKSIQHAARTKFSFALVADLRDGTEFNPLDRRFPQSMRYLCRLAITLSFGS